MPTPKLKALYKRVGPALFARAQRVLKDDAQAQDAVQHVVIELSRMDAMKDAELVRAAAAREVPREEPASTRCSRSTRTNRFPRRPP